MMSALLCVPVLWCCLVLVEAAPWPNFENTQRQACGDKLADIMSLVCSGRGYNVPFRPERGSSSRRVRRQIVDECCRRSCNPALLELYCRADPTEAPSNTPIRKRSDSGYESTEVEEEIVRQSTEQFHNPTDISMKNQIFNGNGNSIVNAVKKPKHNFKLLNLLDPSEQTSKKQKSNDNREEENDTAEEGSSQLNSLRHRRKSHQHSRLRGHTFSAKTKRDEDTGDSKQTFQIGTVRPYFVGKALVSHRSNYVHHTPPRVT